jgi:GNAT superfamily N-acetyltransferase
VSSMHLRPATVEDGRFIANSWLQSFQPSYHVKRMSSDVYYNNHRAILARLVDRGSVMVAADPQDPWTIWGWSCHERDGCILTVHYVYTKHPFRGLKVGSALVRDMIDDGVDHVFWTHDTKSARDFVAGLRSGGVLPDGVRAEYNPYLMYR